MEIGDQCRDAYLTNLGLQVLRFDNRQILQDTDRVVEVIYRTLSARLDCGNPPSPPFNKGGEPKIASNLEKLREVMRYISAYGNKLPRFRVTEAREPESWEQHHPKPDVPDPEVQKKTETAGATHVPEIVPERAATQHTALILGRL